MLNRTKVLPTRQPVRVGLWIILAVAACYAVGDMAAGFFDGLVAGFTDGV